MRFTPTTEPGLQLAHRGCCVSDAEIVAIEEAAVKRWRERMALVHKKVCGITMRDENGERCDCGYLQLLAGTKA